MAESKLNIEVTAEVANALKGFGALEDKVEGLAKTVKGSNLGQSFNQIGQGMVSVGQKLTSTLGSIGGGIVQTAGNFEASMNNVVAVTGVTGKEFEKLEKRAKDLGATTAFSASEAADAMGFLGMAGFDTGEIYKALPKILQLASASGMSLAETADRASNVLGGFNLEVEDLSRVNNVLAETARSANTDVRGLAEAFKDSGPIAASAGVSIEELSAAAGLLGDAGIQSGLAGTALKNIILGLNAPSQRSAKFMREMGFEVIRTADGALDLQANLEKLSSMNATTEQLSRIFGRDIQLAGVEVLLKNLKGLEDQTTALENVGDTAAEMAEIKMQGFAGQMKNLASAFESLQLAIADTGLLEDVTFLVGKFTEFVRTMAVANPQLLKAGVALGAIGFAVGAILIPLGLLTSSVGTLITLFSSGALAAAFPTFTAIGVAIKGMAVGMIAFMAPFLTFVATIGLAVAAGAALAVAIPTIAGGLALLWARILQVGAGFASAIEEFFGFPPIVSNVLLDVASKLEEFAAQAFQWGMKFMSTIGDGIRAGVSAVTGAVSWVWEQATKFMPSSDAKKGPLSNLTNWGKAIPETMAKGVAMAQPMLQNKIVSSLTPADPVASTSNVNSPISVNNNITINGNMDNQQKQDLMAQLDAKAQDMVRMLKRVNDDRMRTKYV